MLLFIGQETAICIPGITDFNTSHVTVYHLYVLSLIFLTRFQYISCYCLSMQEGITGHDARGFQYISCYCLSSLLHTGEKKNTNFNTSHVTVYLPHWSSEQAFLPHFNTSHVTVYQKSGTWLKSLNSYFNTSHVTVYLMANDGTWGPWVISIHLMLLFIQVVYG